MESCKECNRLKREYSEANRDFLVLAADRQRRNVREDATLMAQVDAFYRTTGERRQFIRKAILDHKATHRNTTVV